MNPEDWRRISELFSDCLKLSGAQRHSFLAELEANQPEIAREVRELLAVYEQDNSFLEQPGIDQITSSRIEGPGGQSQTDIFPESLESNSGDRRPKKRPVSFWILLGVDVLALALYIFGAVLIHHYGPVTSTLGWDADLDRGQWRVDQVDAPGPAANKLKLGDVIQGLNGRPAGGALGADLESIFPGSSYAVRVSRNGAGYEFVLTRAIVPNAMGAAGIASYLVVSLAFFLTAVVVGIMKPDQPIAQLAWAALLTEGLCLLKTVLIFYVEFLRGMPSLAFQVLQVVDGPHFGLAYHFYSRAFGSGIKRWRAPLVGLYAWGAAEAIYRLLLVNRRTLAFLAAHVAFTNFWQSAMGVFYLIAPLSICFVLVRNYFVVKEPDEQRRARWIAAGSLAGILPYVIVRACEFVAYANGGYAAQASAYQVAVMLSIIPAVLIPIVTGYAILKHRLFDIDVVIRRGIQYLLARSVLRFALALPALALCYSLVTNANRTVADVMMHSRSFLILLALIGLVLKFRESLGSWLDRKFFREKYRQEHLLIGLIDGIKKLHTVVEMSERVGAELTAALHPESVFVFYHRLEHRAFVRGFSSEPSAHYTRLSDRSPEIAALGREEGPQDLTTFRSSGRDPNEWRWLLRLGVDLIVPMMAAGGSLVGFILLGRKKSEEPYTPTDRRLLSALADQMAILYENISLQERLQEARRTSQQMRARVEGHGIQWLQECPKCGRCFDSSSKNCSEDGSQLISSCPVQQIVDDRYRLDRAIGKGGMGIVFEASDLRLRRKVAIKLVLAGKLDDPGSLRRFDREARALARLSHPNIVATYDFGVIENEASYLVMEFVPGTTLRAEIAHGGIPPAFIADWFGQLLEGVKAAHAAGIVHRDLKPENVLISDSVNGKRQVKIADFGIAKWAVMDLESTSLTAPGTVVGSFHYMSPEQLSGQTVDERSDIFSIGVMLFEALTGQIPFKGKTYTERIVSILQDSPQVESALPGAGPLQKSLMKCLAKDSAQRFTSVAELQAEIIPLIVNYGDRASFKQGR